MKRYEISNDICITQIPPISNGDGDFAQSLREANRLIRKLTRERDHHRMEHRRLVTERDRLAKDMKRLAVHYGKYEPAIALLKYAK